MLIPGIHRKITREDATLSGEIHNTFPMENERPHLRDSDLLGLAKIVSEHKVIGVGIHALHAHNSVEKGNVMATSRVARGGEATESVPVFKKRSISVAELLGNESYSRIVTARKDETGIKVHPSEYQIGSPPKHINSITPEFVEDFATFLCNRNLEGRVGLHLLDSADMDQLLELEDDSGGTVTFRLQDFPDAPTRVAGYLVQDQEGEVSLKGNEFHHYGKNGEHTLFTDGKVIHYPNPTALEVG